MDNVCRSSIYRKYNSTLPYWLCDKPQKFVKHCVERLTSAGSIKDEHVTLDENRDKILLVKSSNVNDIYIVYLGSENSFPSCTWVDWQKSLLPCKHMPSAVIKGVQGASWNSLSQNYRSSSFFQLDKDVVFYQHEPERECDAENNEKSEEGGLEGDVLLKDIPKKCYPKRSKATECRELLNQIKSLTFAVYDNDALDQLYESLLADLKDFSRHAHVEDNLVVEKPRVIRNQTKKFPPLSKPKEKKSALSGRVGVSAEKRKLASAIDVVAKKKAKKLENIIALERVKWSVKVFQIKEEIFYFPQRKRRLF